MCAGPKAGQSQEPCQVRKHFSWYDKKYFDCCQGETGSPLMSPVPGTGQTRLVGLLSWDTDDIDHNRCEVTGLPSVFTKISTIQPWLESVTNIKL